MKRTPKVYLYVFDTMSDWEVGYLTAELNTGRYFKNGLEPLKVTTVGPNKQPVMTMGGLRLMPDISVDACILEINDVLILPGGETWLGGLHEPIVSKASRGLKDGTIVAAICGATAALAKEGLLDSRRHTSNDLEYVKMVCPEYRGEPYYEHVPAVTDANLVTASGLAPLEFAMHMLKLLNVCKPDTLQGWYKLNQTKKPEDYYEFMHTMN